MTVCRYFNDPPADGAWNMAVDETLLEWGAETGGLCWRFYRWQEPTLSLGYFQRCEDRDAHAASRTCPLVRRASGGGAILHDRELTYSVVVPAKHPLAIHHQTLYGTVHNVLIEVLSRFGIAARCCGDGSRASGPSPFLCFQRRSPGDVVVGDVKIAGSAQRRNRGAVLQHGSLLIQRSEAAPELLGLTDLREGVPSGNLLAELWWEALNRSLAWEGQPDCLTDEEQSRAAAIAENKYRSDRWNRHRKQ